MNKDELYRKEIYANLIYTSEYIVLKNRKKFKLKA